MGHYGLIDVYNPSQGAVAHIILVHGLFGHREKTWTCKYNGQKVFWPRDLLPKQFEDVQISSWGYDANIDNWLSSAGSNTLHQHAANLLWDIYDARETLTARSLPIIFVVHGLGGIVVKDALNQSRGAFGKAVKDIAPITKAVCFLGTPHRGSEMTLVRGAVYSARGALTKSPNMSLLRASKKNAPELDRISDGFGQTMLQYQYGICSFREELETRKYFIFNAFVVKSDSAKIGDGREIHGSLHADHEGMAKFTALDDNNFVRVTNRIREWLNEIRSANVGIDDASLSACVSRLTLAGSRIREDDVRKAYTDTSNWLPDANETRYALDVVGKLLESLLNNQRSRLTQVDAR